MAIPNCCGCEARKRSRLLPQSARHLRPLIHLHSLTRGNDSMQTCTDRLIDSPGLAIAGFDFVHRVIVRSIQKQSADERRRCAIDCACARARARARGKSNDIFGRWLKARNRASDFTFLLTSLSSRAASLLLLNRRSRTIREYKGDLILFTCAGPF